MDMASIACQGRSKAIPRGVACSIFCFGVFVGVFVPNNFPLWVTNHNRAFVHLYCSMFRGILYCKKKA
jgi:hypothetical protein